ncbi:post-segregation antitoxin CcdA [Sphingomonas ginsenosidivorax]|jgi:antitoxin CcdA|uniref:Post-segregation antitoxin CcdA n=1 Tax=Sphingomonas ginsenosidivorax TaxID=862135 RepID=A0A5C6ULR5_9SPHN|nr:type II toxin-antitoxin system CcdA family antitoxin [Sphingomonas ginsenosidivorax]TXC72365.1 post-segregation antitoxin CcdA [Sphingomonas ginsenosidivorax]
MKQDVIRASKRKSVNLSIDPDVVAAARDAGINLSRVTEDALRAAVKTEHERRWKAENRDWISAHNAWIDENGIPLSDLETL